jgi:hypothetical protein
MSSTFASTESSIERHTAGNNIWLRRAGADERAEMMAHTPHALNYEVFESEEAVGRAMLAEIEAAGLYLRSDSGRQSRRLFGQGASSEQTFKIKR